MNALSFADHAARYHVAVDAHNSLAGKVPADELEGRYGVAIDATERALIDQDPKDPARRRCGHMGGCQAVGSERRRGSHDKGSGGGAEITERRCVGFRTDMKFEIL